MEFQKIPSPLPQAAGPGVISATSNTTYQALGLVRVWALVHTRRKDGNQQNVQEGFSSRPPTPTSTRNPQPLSLGRAGLCDSPPVQTRI